MPKLPGRKSTRITIDLEEVGDVQSFVGVWDKYAYKKPCQIEGCSHLVSGRHATDEEYKATGNLYVQCEGESDSSGAAIVYDNKPLVAGRRPAHYLICPCCLGKLDEAWRAKHGDPE